MGHGKATSNLHRLKLLPLRKDRGAGSAVGIFIESVSMGSVKSVEAAYKKQIEVLTTQAMKIQESCYERDSDLVPAKLCYTKYFRQLHARKAREEAEERAKEAGCRMNMCITFASRFVRLGSCRE